ncbi:glycosyltransferase family 4 protein [Psychroserpens jangbogonensis]|uniref:glycosyltransferase family 4 protein n=1 Tax=Psychroserpens jangbogonensis TaxID=1484460 RepID=UPI00068C0152|nr:glycosyltransferase family 4 protein [Psychroserpens jangbogonensis]
MMSKGHKIKILLTIPNFDTAGSGKVVYDLVNGLDKTKFDVEIACAHNKGNFFETVEALGLPIHIFETKTAYRPYYSLLFRVLPISKFYKKNNYDIIHSWQWSNDWTEAIAARLAGKKWIYTKKAMGFNKHWKIKSYLAHFIITINNEMKKYFPNKKSQKLIPLGIDTDYYNAAQFEKNKSEFFEVITVANLVPVKGVEVLIRAIHHLSDRKIKLNILGDNDNDYGKSVQELCRELDMLDQVVFHGKQLDVRPYIAKSDLYVIPTLDQGRKEGMPMALVEAMSMGIPILGSNITGINYVLKGFDELLFQAGDFQALANKLRLTRNLKKEERDEIGSALQTYCVNHFAMSTFIKAHEDLYTELIIKK